MGIASAHARRLIRGGTLLPLAALAACLALPAPAGAVGALTQQAGTAGCVNNTGAEGCQAGIRIGGSDLAVSPDGKSVYATGFDSTSAIAVLDRDPATGALTQKTGLDGCWAAGGAGGSCHAAGPMLKPDGIAVSPDGKSVYVADYHENSVLVFDRAPDGALTQKAGADGCLSGSGHGGACLAVNGMTRQSRLVVSPDGESVYAASSGGGGAGAVAIFDRDPETGELSQKAGAAGCVSSDGFSPCGAAVGLGHPEGIAISPDGADVYVTSRSTDTVAIFDRAGDGGLTQRPSPEGCWAAGAIVGCGQGIGLDNGGAVKSPAVSPDGKSLYVPASGTGGVAVFDRDTATGAVTQKSGLAGCISWNGAGGACGLGPALRDAAEVAVSPDGMSVYVAGAHPESGIAVFDRDGVNGELSQRSGTEGCVTPGGNGGACATGRGLPTIALAISPDGRNVYAGGVAVFDRDAPTGGEEEEETPADPCTGDADCDGIADRADACPRVARPGALDGCPLRLDEAAPRSGGAGPVTVRLRGRGFGPSPSVRLVREGHGEIAASSVQRAGAQVLVAGFDLGKAATGRWEVAVSQDGPDAEARAPFTVLAGTPPRLRARLIGHASTISGYPWTAMLQVVNEGTTDARNALVRIDGFQTRADATVIGEGATATHVDSGDSHSLLVSIDRVPQQTTRMLLVRFTAVGPGHSFYFLRPTVLASSLARPRPVDPTLGLTSAIAASDAAGERGAVQFSSGGTTSYSVRLSDQGLSKPSSVKVERRGGGIQIELSATLPPPATAPPGGARASALATASQTGRRLNIRVEGDPRSVRQVEVFEGLNGAYQLTISRAGVLDCLLTRRELSQAAHDDLATLADGVLTAELVKKGTELSPRGNATISFVLAYGPDFMSSTFEAHLGRALRADAAGDPNSPYFGLNAEEIVKVAYRNCLPNPPPPGVETFSLEVLTPEDPNDKVGPAGFRNRRWVAPGTRMPYLVMFENVPTAGAPAHEVRIEDRLDASKLDLSTLELGPVYFGDRVASPPPGSQSWTGTVDLRPEKPLIVEVRAGLDRAGGLLSWHFRGLDPATGELQVLPELGFLPPNKAAPEGQGGVTFSVAQAPGLGHGARIANGATIFFDNQAPIATPVFVNRVDARAPSGAVSSLRLRGRGGCARVAAKWGGKDSGAGIALQDVFVSREGRAPRLWRAQTRRRAGVYRLARPGAYAFQSVATDGAGNAAARADLWSRLGAGVVRGKRGVVLRLRPKAAAKLRVRSLRVLAGGRTVAKLRRVPARLALPASSGAFRVSLVAKAGKGKGKRTLRAGRAVAVCSKR